MKSKLFELGAMADLMAGLIKKDPPVLDKPLYQRVLQLTPKQKKARARNKQQKNSRKKNRP